MMKKLFLVFFLILSFFSIPILIKAEEPGAESQISYERINPSNAYSYGFKRLKEKAFLYLYSFSKQKKADYFQKLVNIRLAELKYVVDRDDMANFETANQRYFATVGQATKYLNDTRLGDKKAGFIKTLETHKPVLEKMRDTYEGTMAQWRFVQDNINYLDLYIGQLSQE